MIDRRSSLLLDRGMVELVNESYPRQLDSAHPSWQSRAQFFAVCARVGRPMQVVVDNWRALVPFAPGLQ